jgi:DNA-binding GntR family transcriptional regulator
MTEAGTAQRGITSLARIDFQAMHTQVYEQIRGVLMRGGFEPGQKVSSRKLAAMLGTSDMPVRAALTRLIAERALTQNANGTFSIPVIGRRRFREVMELRSLLEGEATAQACGNITRQGLEELRTHSSGLNAAIETNTISEYLDFNQRLKFTIYKFVDSQTLHSHIELLWLQAGPFLRHLNRKLPQMASINFHDEAIDALEAREKNKAASAISRDILAGMTYLLSNARFAPDDDAVPLSAPRVSP